MSQLKMIHPHPCDAPRPDAGSGFALRDLCAGDELGLVRLYTSAGLGITGVEEIKQKLFDHQSFRPDRVRLAEHDCRLVGAVAAFVDRDDATQGFLHLLAVAPAVQGRGLGRLLVCEALRLCCLDNCRQQWLLTDDQRGAAIRLYLRLGYRPVYLDDAHQARWERLRRELTDLPRWEPVVASGACRSGAIQ